MFGTRGWYGTVDLQSLSVTSHDTEPRLKPNWSTVRVEPSSPSTCVHIKVARMKRIRFKGVQATVTCILECYRHPQSNALWIRILGLGGQLVGGPQGLILEDVRVSFSVTDSNCIPLSSDLSASPGILIVSTAAQLPQLHEQRVTGTSSMLPSKLTSKPALDMAAGTKNSYEGDTTLATAPLAEEGAVQDIMYVRNGLRDAGGASCALTVELHRDVFATIATQHFNSARVRSLSGYRHVHTCTVSKTVRDKVGTHACQKRPGGRQA